MPQTVEPFQLPNHFCIHSLQDVVMWNSLSIHHIWLQEASKISFLIHSPWQIVLTMLLGQMLDVARYEQYGGNLQLLCQG
jgi:hypothetical protein